MKLFVLFPLLLAVAITCDSPPPTSLVTATQKQNFINVEGLTLKSKLESAIKQGSSGQKRFWAAYTFDVRPGIMFDALIVSSDGSRIVNNGRTFSPNYETRNVGIFLLHEQDGRSIARVEIYNLDRPREYAGYPVYWLGRGSNQESLDLLRSLIETSRSRQAAERMTDAIGAHDDQRVAAILKDLIRKSSIEKVRTTAVSWVGYLPGETPFLAGLVRDERESLAIRKEAADAIGESSDGEALVLLQNLYRSIAHREVKREILDAIAESNSAEALTTLEQLYGSISDRELKREVIEAFEDCEDRKAAVDFLIRVARTDSDRQARERAISTLGGMNDDRAADALAQLFDEERNDEMKVELLSALGDSNSNRALKKLMDVAKGESSLKLRKKAISLLGESGDPDAVKFLEGLIK